MMRFLDICAILAVTAITAVAASAREFTLDPGRPDSVIIDSSRTAIPLPGVVTLSFVNDEPISLIEITLTIASGSAIFDSASYQGSRLLAYNEHWLKLSPVVLNLFTVPSFGELIAPGRGLLCRIYLSYPPGTLPQTVVLDTTTFVANLVEHSTYFADSASNAFRPGFRKGVLAIVPPCCVGERGNIDGSPDQIVDISDITSLVDYLFISANSSLACPEESDLDTPPDRQVDISDLTRLVEYLYIYPTSAQLPPCP